MYESSGASFFCWTLVKNWWERDRVKCRSCVPNEVEKRQQMVVETSYGFNMADDTRKIRVEEQLRIKIGDAKDLVGRNGGTNGSTGVRDVFCTIALDQEEICRTPTIERTLTPFFGEEYQFEIPRYFRYLSVYVWDRDRHLKQVKAVGKVAIRREDLHEYNDKDYWFSLRPVDADSEVQGLAHIQVTVDDGAGNLKRKSDFDEMASSVECDIESVDEVRSGERVTRNESLRQAIRTSNTLTKTKSIFGNTDLTLWSGTQSKKTSVNMLDTLSPFRGEMRGRVAVRIVECGNLAKKNGNCDPYVVLSAMYSNNRVIKKRTKIRKKTINPVFDETVVFDMSVDGDSKSDGNNAYTIVPLGGADLCEITVGVWHSGGMGEDVFLGQVKLPLRGRQEQNAIQADAWYFLQPRPSHSRPVTSCATPNGTRLSCNSSLGTLRLRLHYAADHVFPLATYDALLNLLLQSVEQRPVTTTAVHILGEVVSNKTDVAQPLVRLFTYKNKIAPMIKALADYEISKLTDPTTIFRGNTLVSKMMDEAMRLTGIKYLHQTLRPVVDDIVQEKKPCEIDPSRLKDTSAIDGNLQNLQEYVERVFNAITTSAVRCPAVLCQIFHDLKESAKHFFPDNREVRYSVVSGFIFLRFFAPAILGPKLFDLTTEPLDEQTNRTFTLISKTIQSLGNLVSSRSAQQLCKEEYTGRLYKAFSTEKHMMAVKHFLEVVSTVGASCDGNKEQEPILLKEGMMTKRAQNKKIFFKQRNFKQRYFRLTTQSLSYSKSKGQKPSCDIPLSDILAVERLNECSFKMQNIFQIVRKDRPLYVQTANCVEEKEWVDLLRKICQSNAERLEHYHPCAYINNVWTCCNSRDQNANGCTAVSPKSFQMELGTALDPARDLQRIHTLIMSNMKCLESMGNPMAYSGTPQQVSEFMMCHETLKALREVAIALDHVHRNHRTKLAMEVKYGSRQAPIGDDNYLHMSKGGRGGAFKVTPTPRDSTQESGDVELRTIRPSFLRSCE
ncbi:GTPase-activating protein [Phlebotomus argentipes]|uniref:GTPase-activating protein n=1 Tax=Phlebotomus argentipes TaxID=94469 RepID=UPI002892E971|nr:GTPase-activating protein [Phlebotomus argentipes]